MPKVHPNRLLAILKVLVNLGILNLLRVGVHRLKVKLGWSLKTQIAYQEELGRFFVEQSCDNAKQKFDISLFGWRKFSLADSPCWHSCHPWSHARYDPSLNPFRSLTSLPMADPKLVWELSRFYWAPRLALLHARGDEGSLQLLNNLLHDWCQNNKAYEGINWSCGQEAAIRSLHLLCSNMILGIGTDISPATSNFFELHATRIKATFGYAIGQDNNHGLAEACALLCLGQFGHNFTSLNSSKIRQKGRYWLKNRLHRLILPDGSPSQKSVSYHRANLEILLFAKLVEMRTDSPIFDSVDIKRIVAGARWLHTIIDPETGHVPNLGANDGSNLFNFTDKPIDDYRPTVSLAARLFDSADAWPDYEDERINVWQVPPPNNGCWDNPRSKWFREGGGGVIFAKSRKLFFHAPKFNMRPSQADVFHVDLWSDGINLLRDAGTFSYVSGQKFDFSGTRAHNTVHFDNRSQMPKLSPFLYTNWIKSESQFYLDEFMPRITALYTDYLGARHERALVLSDKKFECVDNLSGAFSEACIVWRLAPIQWVAKEEMLSTNNFQLKIEVDGVLAKPNIRFLPESRYYQHSREIPVALVYTYGVSTVRTELRFI